MRRIVLGVPKQHRSRLTKHPTDNTTPFMLIAANRIPSSSNSFNASFSGKDLSSSEAPVSPPGMNL
jgi:hypothetical protein